MKFFGKLAVTAAGLLLLSQSAALAEEKPLRHLVYKVGVTTTTQETVQSFGADTGTLGAGSMAHGVVTADILAFTPDNAFRVQISEQIDAHAGPKIEVDIAPDGSVRVKPDDAVNISEEEQVLLRSLARNFVTADDIKAGSWVVAQKQGQNSDNEEYRVKSTSGAGDLSIELDQRVMVKDGPQPSDTSGHGNIVYSSKYSVPKTISLDSITRSGGIAGGGSREIKIEYELVSDSFMPAQ